MERKGPDNFRFFILQSKIFDGLLTHNDFSFFDGLMVEGGKNNSDFVLYWWYGWFRCWWRKLWVHSTKKWFCHTFCVRNYLFYSIWYFVVLFCSLYNLKALFFFSYFSLVLPSFLLVFSLAKRGKLKNTVGKSADKLNLDGIFLGSTRLVITFFLSKTLIHCNLEVIGFPFSSTSKKERTQPDKLDFVVQGMWALLNVMPGLPGAIWLSRI